MYMFCVVYVLLLVQAKVVAESKSGVMVSTAVHCLIDTAHAITDFYLPPDKTNLFINQGTADIFQTHT